MVILPILLAAAVSAAPAKPASRKDASWSDLAAWVSREGKQGKIGPKTVASLGLGAAALPVTEVWFAQEQSSDDLGRVMSVARDQEGRAEWLILQVERATATPEGKLLDAYGFRLDPSGTLKAAMSVKGVVGRLKHERLPLEAADTQERLRKESRFWRGKAMSLPLKLE